MQAVSDWIIWQLADSAFPSGGFAHSAGLEAAWQLGEVDGPARLVEFLRGSLLQAARGAAPFALAAGRDPGRVCELDQACDAFLSNAVANRASRAQGQGFLAAASRTLGGAGLIELRAQVRREASPGHWAVAFGAVGGILGLESPRLARLLLFVTLRGLVSSAVRLGIVGPMQAQTLQFELHPYGEALAERALEWGVEDASQASPVIELVQGLHDRLYSRLFLS
ncbi:MAG: ureF [Phycisphaerales bacterium]|nr:ureF [Phycisphaerales bacterium]